MIRTFLFSLVMAAAIFLSSAAKADVDSMDVNDLLFFFDVVHVHDGFLIITRSQQDLSYKIQIGDGPITDSPPGSTFKLPPGVPCRIFNHQSVFRLMPAYEKMGILKTWLVEEVNRRGDVHVCMLRGRRHLEGVSKPFAESLVLEPTEAKDETSLRRLEKECGVTGEATAKSAEDKK